MAAALQRGSGLEKFHVDKVSVTVDGPEGMMLSARGFELSVAVNSIPSISIDVLPIDEPPPPQGSTGNSPNTKASSPSFSEITDLYNRLLSMAEKKDKKANLIQIVAKPNSDSEDQKKYEETSLSLKDWILTDVGLSSVTTFSSPSLVVVFSHPACRLDRTGMIYSVPDSTSLSAKLETAAGGNVVSTMDAVYGMYSGGQLQFKHIKKRKHGSVVDQFRTTLGSKENLPGTYLKCSCGLFLEKLVTGDLHRRLMRAIADVVKPSFGSESTWKRIVSSICPSMLMQVMPTYDKSQLEMVPYEPWKPLEHTIPEEMVESISLPSLDPDPICGVAALDPVPYPPGRMNTRTVTSIDQTGSPFSFYIPDKVNPQKPNGRMLEVVTNKVMAEMIRSDVAYVNSNSNLDKSEVSRRQEVSDQVGEKYAEAMFESIYRSGCTASVTTSLLFKDKDGKTIYPGRVATVAGKNVGAGAYGAENEEKLFYGYLVKMKMSGSTDGRCRTVFEFSTVRQVPGKGEQPLVEEGTLNPCYK